MIIGLTGNIGSGKSTVAKIFETLEIPVYNADENARKLYLIPDIVNRISETLQENIMNEEGKVDISLLSSLVFNDTQKLTLLNQIIHPVVIEDIRLWSLTVKSFPYCIVESAIIFEHQFEYLFEKIIVVTAPETIRLKRILQRDSIEAEDVRKRFKTQLEESQKVQKADFVVYNDDMQAVIPQVQAIHYKLMGNAKA